MTRRPRIVTVLGTRPEAIKLAPVVAALREHGDVEARVVVTGQHREIADEVLRAFGVAPDADLDLLRHGQTLAALTARAVDGLDAELERAGADMVLVQGDTTTAFVAALAAFYRRIPVGHVEAGLRTYDLDAPWPEEANRRLIGVVTAMHFAPTPLSKQNLLSERVPSEAITVTGNTSVDALRTLVPPAGARPASPQLAEALRSERLVLVTSHRRESWGEPQRAVAASLRRAALAHPEATFFVPLHPNPIVRDALVPPLSGLPNVILSEPIGYRDMLLALRHCYVAVTDSGGIQEEGCVVGAPVLLLRDVTERPEGVEAGVVKIVGTSPVRLLAELDRLLTSPVARARAARATGVFGDGLASRRIVAAIRRRFDLPAEEMPEFVPALEQRGGEDLHWVEGVTA